MSKLQDEMRTLDLHDKRLNRRARLLLERLAQRPQVSIPAACGGWSETDAAYKFFANPRVTPERILQPHYEAMRQRCDRENTILLVQDTTELDFTQPRRSIAGLGVLERPERQGCYLHLQVAFTPEGCCLGVAGAQFLTRTADSLGKTRQRARLPIDQKESQRWLDGYHRACRLQQELPVTRVISVADCEADIYELFVAGANAATRRSRKAHWIVRAKQDRRLPDPDPELGPDAYQKLWSTLEAAPVQFSQTLTLPTTPKRRARKARLEVRAQAVTLKPTYRANTKLPAVTFHAVLAQEVDPPSAEEAIEWLLLTSLPIETAADIQRILDSYRGRWPIEPYFRTLKTGCKVEQLRLESAQRLFPCIAMYLIVTWRVLFVTMLGRRHPSLPADAVFTEAEWKSVWQAAHHEEPPRQPPELQVYLRTLAKLGGYLNRKRDPPPGPQAIWIGLRRMADYADAWILFRPTPASKPP